MRILREWLGHSEEIDLGTDEGWRYFAQEVVQNEDMATHYMQRLARRDEVIVNEDEAEFIERWTVFA